MKELEEELNQRITKKKAHFRKFNEFLLLPFALIIYLVLYYIGVTNQLTIGRILGLGFSSWILLFFIRFDEQTARPFRHYFRIYESYVFFFVPFLFFLYLITILTQSPFPNPIHTANVFVAYALSVFIWVWFSSLPIVGLVFAFDLLFNWAGFISSIFQQHSSLPFMAYLMFFLCFIAGVISCFNQTFRCLELIRQPEDFGGSLQKIRLLGAMILIGSVVVGVVLLVYRPFIMEQIVFILELSW